MADRYNPDRSQAKDPQSLRLVVSLCPQTGVGFPQANY